MNSLVSKQQNYQLFQAVSLIQTADYTYIIGWLRFYIFHLQSIIFQVIQLPFVSVVVTLKCLVPVEGLFGLCSV